MKQIQVGENLQLDVPRGHHPRAHQPRLEDGQIEALAVEAHQIFVPLHQLQKASQDWHLVRRVHHEELLHDDLIALEIRAADQERMVAGAVAESGGLDVQIEGLVHPEALQPLVSQKLVERHLLRHLRSGDPVQRHVAVAGRRLCHPPVAKLSHGLVRTYAGRTGRRRGHALQSRGQAAHHQ